MSFTSDEQRKGFFASKGGASQRQSSDTAQNIVGIKRKSKFKQFLSKAGDSFERGATATGQAIKRGAVVAGKEIKREAIIIKDSDQFKDAVKKGKETARETSNAILKEAGLPTIKKHRKASNETFDSRGFLKTISNSKGRKPQLTISEDKISFVAKQDDGTIISRTGSNPEKMARRLSSKGYSKVTFLD